MAWIRTPPEGGTGDEFSGDASGSLFSKILGGIIVPVVLAVNGVLDIIYQEATLPGKRAFVELTGMPAVIMGIVYIGIGLFLHFHYVWTVSEKLFRLAAPAKTLALLISLAGFLYVCYHIIMH